MNKIVQKLQKEGDQKTKRKQALLNALLKIQKKVKLSVAEKTTAEKGLELMINSYKTAADYVNGEVKIKVATLAKDVLSFQVKSVQVLNLTHHLQANSELWQKTLVEVQSELVQQGLVSAHAKPEFDAFMKVSHVALRHSVSGWSMLQSGSIAEQSHEEDAKEKAKEILLHDYNGSDGVKAARRDARRADLNKQIETNEHADEVNRGWAR